MEKSREFSCGLKQPLAANNIIHSSSTINEFIFITFRLLH